jgi:hypothetical protein
MSFVSHFRFTHPSVLKAPMEESQYVQTTVCSPGFLPISSDGSIGTVTVTDGILPPLAGPTGKDRVRPSICFDNSPNLLWRTSGRIEEERYTLNAICWVLSAVLRANELPPARGMVKDPAKARKATWDPEEPFIS